MNQLKMLNEMGLSQISNSESFEVQKGEVWALKSISGNLNTNNSKIKKIIIAVIASNNIGERKVLFSHSFSKPKGTFSVGENADSFIGRICGPFENSFKVSLSLKIELNKNIKRKKNKKIKVSENDLVVATFHRISPKSDSAIQNLFTSSSISTQLAPIEAPPVQSQPQSDTRFLRDIYFIKDPSSEFFEEPEMVPAGYHKCHDGSYHPCPTCVQMLLDGDQSGGMEILSGGEAEIIEQKIADIPQIKNDSDGQAEKIDESFETQIVKEFKDGRKASEEEKEKQKIGGKNRPGSIKCQGCGEESKHEKQVPLCKRSCPFVFENDVMASSWHKAPNGKYHYCPTCFDLVMEANKKT